MTKLLVVFVFFTAFFSFLLRAEGLSKWKSLKIEKRLIACDVCRLAIIELVDLVGETRTEEAALDISEQLCDPDSESGALWASVDVQRLSDGSGVALVDMRPEVQFCTKECRRAAKMCSSIMEEYDGDISELIAEEMEATALVDKVCVKWSKSCVETPLPEGFVFRIDDAPFRALTAEGLETVARLRKNKKMQAKTNMGLGPQIDRLEKELREGGWTKVVEEKKGEL